MGGVVTLTLLVIPTIYEILADARDWTAARFRRRMAPVWSADALHYPSIPARRPSRRETAGGGPVAGGPAEAETARSADDWREPPCGRCRYPTYANSASLQPGRSSAPWRSRSVVVPPPDVAVAHLLFTGLRSLRNPFCRDPGKWRHLTISFLFPQRPRALANRPDSQPYHFVRQVRTKPCTLTLLETGP